MIFVTLQIDRDTQREIKRRAALEDRSQASYLRVIFSKRKQPACLICKRPL